MQSKLIADFIEEELGFETDSAESGSQERISKHKNDEDTRGDEINNEDSRSQPTTLGIIQTWAKKPKNSPSTPKRIRRGVQTDISFLGKMRQKHPNQPHSEISKPTKDIGDVDSFDD